MRTGAQTRRTGVSRGGRDRFEKAEEAVESRRLDWTRIFARSTGISVRSRRMLCIVSPSARSLSVSACYAKSRDLYTSHSFIRI